MTSGRRRIGRGTIASTVLAVAAWVAVMWLFKHRFPTYEWLAAEDRPGENLTALFYAVAAVAVARAGWQRGGNGRPRLRGGAWYFLLALFFFFVAGEEVSWGQRWLGIAVPETIREHNVQGELNLHNLALFDRDRAVLNQQTVLKAFVLGYGLLLPWAAALWGWCRRLVDRLGMPLMPAVASGWFVVALLHWQTFAKVHPHWTHSEVCELLVATGFFLGSLAVARNTAARTAG